MKFSPMNLPRRLFLLVAVFALLAQTLLALPALAQEYPNRPIRILIPFPPGSPAALAGFIESEIGQWNKAIAAAGLKAE